MNNKDMELEDIVITKCNIHHGDIANDYKFDCENNCPYCNDQIICIKLQYVLPVSRNAEYDGSYKHFECQLCGKEFGEIWEANERDYYYPSDEDYDFSDDLDDYSDAYFEAYLHERHNAFCHSYDQAIETGNLCTVALYKYTIITPTIYENKCYSELRNRHNYPIYRRLTPEIVDIFGLVELGPLESRFDILDLRLNDIQDGSFIYIHRG